MGIRTEKTPDGKWLAMTDCPPWMCVEADTEGSARSIVDRALIWYLERESQRRYLEMVAALEEITQEKPAETEVVVQETVIVDTAPSEITIYDGIPHYMDGGDGGC